MTSSSFPLLFEQPASLTHSSPALTLLSSTASADAQPTSQSIWHACQTGDLPYIRLFLASLPTLPSSHHSSTSELNSLNSLYESPVHVAASYNQLAALQLLLDAQPAPLVSLQDRESGWTALHRACYRGHLACAAALVQAGVDVTVVDYEDRTAFDLLLTRDRPAHFLQLPGRRASGNDSDDDDDSSHSRNRSSYHSRRMGHEQRQLSAWRGRLSHQLYTFGSNRNYQLGLPSDASQHDKPRHVLSLATANITTVACTRLTSFALSHSTGALYAWGQGGNGRLGSGLEGSEVMPRRIATGKVRVVDIDADERYACAVGERGEVLVWGQAEWLGKEREMRRERERDKEERKEREDTLRAIKSMPASERADYQAQKDAERRERDEKERERREEREKDKQRQQQADCTFLTPTRLESCRHLIVTAVSCSSQRLFLLTKTGELWYLGHALDDGSVTCVPKRLAAMSELLVRDVRSTARAVVVVTREGEVYQQVKGERKCYRVMFRFSTFSTFSTGTASASATVVTSTYSPTLSPSSPPFSPPLPSTASTSSSRRRLSAYPRIVRLSVSVSAERCMALTNNGECYWWKIHQDEAVVSGTNSPPLASNQLAGSYAFPPFYLSSPAPTSSPFAASSYSSSGGRKVAHLVPGISHLRVVDIALGNGHTTVVTDLGDVWHWGKTPLLSHYSSRPQRVNYLHQAVRVWCSDQHVICSTVYHTPPLQAEVQSSEVATLRSMCETQLARHISLSSLLPAVSFAISLSLPSMFQYSLDWLLCNFNILVHPAMKRLSVDDWSVIQQYYSGINDGQDDEAVLRRAGGHGGAGARSVAHFGLVGEGEERHIGFYTARDDDEGDFDGEDETVSGEHSEDSEEDEESREERTSKDGVVNLLAVKQWEKGSEQRRQARDERRRKRRIEEKEAELRERKREEEERWREGLTDAEIVQRLKNQLRATRKKQRRREEKKAEGEEDEIERRQLWVASEKIKGELRTMSDAGCVEARVVLNESEGERGSTGNVEERKEDDVHTAVSAAVSPPPSATALSAASSFESPSSQPTRATSVVERGKALESRESKPAGSDKPSVGKRAASAAKVETKEPTEVDKSKQETKGWGRSLVSTVTPSSAASSCSPLSLFASIQREQEQAAAAATPRKAASASKPAAITTPSAVTPPSAASPTTSTPASRSLTSNPWGKAPTSSPATVLSSSPAPSTATVSVSALTMRPMSLAEIQQEEESKQRRAKPATKQAARSTSSVTAASSILTSPTTPMTTSPPLSSTPAPFMLQLADYIPTPVASSSPAARTPQRGWNVSSSTSPPLPSLSLRSIQQEEAVLLPSSAVARGGASVSPKSVVWGRADVLRVGAVVAVAGVREVQEEEERTREEERLRRALEEASERERTELKQRKKEARKQRAAERKEQKLRQQLHEQQQQQQSVAVPVAHDEQSAAVDGGVHAVGAGGRGGRGTGGRGYGSSRGGRGGRGGVGRESAASVYDVLGVSKPAADGVEHGVSQAHSHGKGYIRREGVRGGRGGCGGGADGGSGGERGQRRGRGRGHAEWVAKKPVGVDEHKDAAVVHSTPHVQQQA